MISESANMCFTRDHSLQRQRLCLFLVYYCIGPILVSSVFFLKLKIDLMHAHVDTPYVMAHESC